MGEISDIFIKKVNYNTLNVSVSNWCKFVLERQIHKTKNYHLKVLCVNELHKQILRNHFEEYLLLMGFFNQHWRDKLQQEQQTPLMVSWEEIDVNTINFFLGGKVSFVILEELEKSKEFTSLDSFIAIPYHTEQIFRSRLRGNATYVDYVGKYPYYITYITTA